MRVEIHKSILILRDSLLLRCFYAKTPPLLCVVMLLMLLSSLAGRCRPDSGSNGFAVTKGNLPRRGTASTAAPALRSPALRPAPTAVSRLLQQFPSQRPPMLSRPSSQPLFLLSALRSGQHKLHAK